MTCRASPQCIAPFKRGDLTTDSLLWSVNSAKVEHHEECFDTATWLLTLSVGRRMLVWFAVHYGMRLVNALSLARWMKAR